MKEFANRLAQTLFKKFEEKFKDPDYIHMACEIKEEQIEFTIQHRHTINYSMEFTGNLETEAFVIMYENKFFDAYDTLYVTIFPKLPSMIKYLNMHVDGIADLIISLITF
ncbi:MAG: hypothetical protein QXP36_03775 [Conexivisphaerales archaeon]